MNIQREPFSDAIFEEIAPLAQKCWEESSAVKRECCAYGDERPKLVDPDRGTYQRISDRGGLVLVTLRDEGQLKGFVVGFLYHSWHLKNALCGGGDSIYVEPEYRGHAPALAECFEQEMKAAGVEIIGWPTHREGPVYRFLKSRGYVGDDIVMEKRLCA